MKRCGLFGIIIGSFCSALSWAGNIPGHLSVFPDLISILAPPALVFLLLRLVAPSPGLWSLATTRRAGRFIVGTGAISFAVGHTWMVLLRVPTFRLLPAFQTAKCKYQHTLLLFRLQLLLAVLSFEGRDGTRL